jgi:hypothetical protein
MKQRAKQDDKTCLINSEGGHSWMTDYYDTLSAPVRRRLRSSPYNLCPACLQLELLPKVRAKHRNWSREKLLFAAIEVMEAEARKQVKS